MQLYILPVLASLSHGVLGQALDANGVGCQVIGLINTACQAVTPGFTAITDFSSRASCACYYSGTWAPRLYDNYFGSCYSFIKTGNPTALPTVVSGGPITTPCQAAGNVRRVSATTSLSTLPQLSVTSDPNYRACAAIENAGAQCAGQSSGFATLPWSRQASCFCYSGRAYAPTGYDNAWKACLSYLSTGNPSAYATLTSLGPITTTPCAAWGDVQDTRSISRPPTSSLAPSSAVPSSAVTSSGQSSSQATPGPTTSGVVTPNAPGPVPPSSTSTARTAGGPKALRATEKTTIRLLWAATAVAGWWILLF